ncbi:beta-ketoacyl-ACP synthase II [Candidatus Babeliales bacterium]|nr:beta-ketoacyl-ACP synthase II [Candidatus Babeliales bacterium]
MSHKRRVVITGIGLVTPLGNNTLDTWNNLIEGHSGLSIFDHHTITNYPYKVFGRVTDDQELIDKIIPSNKKRKTDRFIHLAMLAADQAIRDSGFDQNNPKIRDRFGTCIGVGIGGVSSINQASVELEKSGVKRVSPFLIPKAIINQAGAQLSMMWNLQGPMSSIVNACSSSGDAVGFSFRMIRDGYVDQMLTGGSESCIIPLAIGAFGNMRSLSSWNGDPKGACRPFDRDRSGFVMSEGAGLLVLERMDFAKDRGANIYAELVGYGSTSDAYHITAMHPEGRGAVKSIRNALYDAKIDCSRVGYINAHGTSTVMNDLIETLAIKKVFGKNVEKNNPKRSVISSTKSMTGHMLGAAGGTEISFTALALKNQIFPPTINLENPDPQCDLDYIPHNSREFSCNYAISNSFGFGGGNSVLVLKKV